MSTSLPSQSRARPGGSHTLIAEAPSTRYAGRGHLKALDGIRGIAILMVLFHHAFLANVAAGGRSGQLIGYALHYGQFGVDLFFVLSGFLITGILLDTQSDSHFFKKFYGRRVLRIFPLYYGTLFVLFALTPLMHLNWQGMRLLLLLDLQNFRPALVGNFMLAPNLGLFHFWSLAIEEQFYLLWPAAVFFISDRRTLFRTTVALAVASLALRLLLIATGSGSAHDTLAILHVSTIFRADSLLVGGIIAMLYRSEYWPRTLRLAPPAFFASLVLVALSVLLFGANEDRYLTFPYHPSAAVFWLRGLRYTVVAIGFGALIVWSLRPASVVQATFEQPILRFFGKYSYGLYVLHVPILTLILFPLRIFLRDLTHSKGIAVVGSGLLGLCVALAAAVLSFELFEKPFLRLKRFFDYDPPQTSRRDFPPGTVVDPPFSDKINGVAMEAIPRHSLTIR